MWEFNWSMFWAVLAAFSVRGAFRGIKRIIVILANDSPNRETTLRDIWELLA